MTRSEFRRLFIRERNRFARDFPWVADARVKIHEGRCPSNGRCSRRDLAYSQLDTGQIIVAARLLDLPRANIVGVLRHEFGHLSDERVYERGSERRADRIAERVGGTMIRYDEYDIQTIAAGRHPRPSYLPR